MVATGHTLQQVDRKRGMGRGGGTFAQMEGAVASVGEFEGRVEFVAEAVEDAAGGTAFQTQDGGGVMQPVLWGGERLARASASDSSSSRGQRMSGYFRLSRSRAFQICSVGPAWFIE